MMSDTQREVAIHLLANALRKARPHDRTSSSADAAIAIVHRRGRRSACDETYLRGMLDMLTALYGSENANDLFRAAKSLERSMSTR